MFRPQNTFLNTVLRLQVITSKKLIIISLLALFYSIISNPVLADVTSQHQLIDAIESNPKSLDAAVRRGKGRASLCSHCHGIDGNSKRNYIPNLAAQNPKYLINQFDQFATGKRKNYVMTQLAETISHEDRAYLAIYFSQQEAKSFTLNPDNEKRLGKILTQASTETGKAGFQAKCQMCHGNEAQGWQQLPRLAGQPASYLSKTLLKFKKQHRDRPNSPMVSIAAELSEKEINDISAYLSLLE